LFRDIKDSIEYWWLWRSWALCLRASASVENRIGGAFGTGAGVEATSQIAFMKLKSGLKESAGPTTGASRKDSKDEGKYLLIGL
jgi:hypothetical protein